MRTALINYRTPYPNYRGETRVIYKIFPARVQANG
jgi:hypothetical protein